MAIRNFLRDDFQYLIFSEIYQSLGTRKQSRVAFQILEATIDCIAKKGSSNLTMKAVERSSGVTSSKICYYFKNLETLKVISVKYIRILYQTYVIESLESVENLEQAFEVYFESCLTWPRYFPKHSSVWIAFLHSASLNDSSRAINSEAVSVGLKRLEALVAKFRDDIKDTKKVAKGVYLVHTLITGLLLSEATEEFSGEEKEARRGFVKSLSFRVLMESLAT